MENFNLREKKLFVKTYQKMRRIRRPRKRRIFYHFLNMKTYKFFLKNTIFDIDAMNFLYF